MDADVPVGVGSRACFPVQAALQFAIFLSPPPPLGLLVLRARTTRTLLWGGWLVLL